MKEPMVGVIGHCQGLQLINRTQLAWAPQLTD